MPYLWLRSTVTNSEIVAQFLSSHITLIFTAEQCMKSLKSGSEFMRVHLWQRFKPSFSNNICEQIIVTVSFVTFISVTVSVPASRIGANDHQSRVVF